MNRRASGSHTGDFYDEDQIGFAGLNSRGNLNTEYRPLSNRYMICRRFFKSTFDVPP